MASFTLEELLIILLALAAGGLVKGVTGMGLPLLTVPIMAGFLGVERAVLTMVIPALVLNAYQVFTHRDEARAMPEWPRMLLAGVPGAALGASVLHLASNRFLGTALAVWILLYLLFRLFHPKFVLTLAARLRWSPAVGMLAGAMQAATGISAPIVAAYADAMGLSPRAYVFAVCAPFGAYAAAHFVIVSVSGLYTPDVFVQSLLAVLPAIAAIPIGARLRGLISRRGFELMIRSILIVMAARLFYVAWS